MTNSMTKINHRCRGYTPPAAHDIRNGRGLARAEEHELAGLIANGDCGARDRLVVANLGLVVAIACDFRGRGLDVDDLIGEGNLGLIRAAEKFDSSFGVRFSTYAPYWIKAKIRSALMDTAQPIRVPNHAFRLLVRWRRAETMLCRQWGRVPRFEDVASDLDLSPAQKSTVAQALAAYQAKPDRNQSGEPGPRSRNEVPDHASPCEDRVDSEDEWSVARLRMCRLELREQAIVKVRYGLEGERLTLQEAALRFGITKEGARQLEIRAMRKLQDDHSPPVVTPNIATRVRRRKKHRRDNAVF